ncbi:MAG: MCE family protein, partial [Deltaproteobacteria bacterium]|nr:MCE family protein [Deltaproteobacteria bacterium]
GVGAPVKISGVTLGKVRKVEFFGGKFDQENKKRVYVRATLKIDKEHLSCLHRDAKFYITTLGILGEKYVEIDPGSLEEPVVQENDVLDGVPPLRMEILAMNVSRILDNIAGLLSENKEAIRKAIESANKLLASTEELISANREKISLAVDNVVAASSSLAQTASKIDKSLGTEKEVAAMVNDAREILRGLNNDVVKPLKEFGQFFDKAKRLVDTFAEAGEEGKKGVTEIREKVSVILKDAAELVAYIKDGKGSLGAFLKDKEIYDDLIEMIKDLKRHPWKFLWKE